MPSALFRPPRLRTIEAEVGRRTTWFELFFDLVFVLAIAALARNLHDDHSLTGFVGFVGLSVPVWWAWVIYTFYADRFDTDDVVYRLMVMAGMVAIAAMAASLRTALHGGASTFVVAYLLVRAVPALLYIRAARHEPQARRIARNFGTGSLAAACFWLPSLAVPTPWRYVLWGCAVAIETTLPLIVRRTVAATPMHVSHLGERFGLFTIIVIGEAVVAVGASVASVTWHAGTVAAAICAFAIAGALWWIYFDFGSDAVAASSFWRTQLYVFGHLPVVVGITALAAGSRLAIQHADDSSLSTGARVALCGGAALYLLAISIVSLAEPSLPGQARRTRVAAAVAALLLLAFGSFVRPPVLVALLFVVLAAEGASELWRALPAESEERLENDRQTTVLEP